MTLVVSKMGSTNKFPRVPEGTYMGRLQSIIDIGVQPQTDWKTGKEIDPKPRVLLTWELPTERIEIENEETGEVESKPRWMSKEYTISNFDQSNLMKLKNAMAKGSEIETLDEILNIESMIQVGSTATDNAKIVSVVPAPVGMDVPPLENEPVSFDFDDPTEEAFLKFPAWIQEKIKGAENYNGFADEWE